MKTKRFLTAILAMAMTVSCCFNASAKGTEKITVPVTMDRTVTTTVNGYIAEISYNPDVLSPVLMGNDLLGSGCYAESTLDSGYLTADKVSEGKIIVGWADKDFHSLDNSNILANITFDVIGTADVVNEYGSFTGIDTKIYQVASYNDVMVDGEYSNTAYYSLGTAHTETSLVADETASGSAIEF